MEIDARLFPPSLYGPFRQVLQGSDFGERKPAEKLHVDQFCKFRLNFRQLIQCITDRREFLGVDQILTCFGLQRSNFEFTAALDRVAAPGMINDQSAHPTLGIPHEPRPVGKPTAFTRGDVEIGLVQKSCDTQACRRSPSCQFPFRQSVQFRIQAAEELICGCAIAAFSCADERGNCRPHAAHSRRRIALSCLQCRTFRNDNQAIRLVQTSKNICSPNPSDFRYRVLDLSSLNAETFHTKVFCRSSTLESPTSDPCWGSERSEVRRSSLG